MQSRSWENCYLCLNQSAFNSGNEWFVDDIIGCRVFEEKFIGCVSDVLKLPTQDVWSVIIVVNEEEILIPVAKEIVSSAIANKIITLNIEGL